MTTKHCSKCCRHLQHAAFNKNRAAHDGLSGYCRDCQRKYCREWDGSTFDDEFREFAARHGYQLPERTYTLKPWCSRETRDSWPRIIGGDARLYDLYRGFRAEYSSKLAARHSAYMERYEARQRRRQAGEAGHQRRARRLRAAVEGLTAAEWDRIRELCYEVTLLGRVTGERFALDHRVPLKKAGRHHPDNLQVIPWLMNSRKNAMDHDEALRRVPGYRDWTEGPNTFEQSAVVVHLGGRQRLYHLD